MTKQEKADKRFAVVCQWKDNPLDFQVIDYFESVELAEKYIKTLPKDKTRFTYEVMKYD